jgi:hypothetical protein
MKAKNGITRIRIAAAAAVGILGLMVAAPAPAADSIAVPVSAAVSAVCKFSTPQSPEVVIANSGVNIDPSISGTATGNANINYRCTNGSTPTFDLTGGATATLTCSTPGTCGVTTMDATMVLTPPTPATGQGFAAAPRVLLLTGTIADTIYGPAQEGTYSGSKTVTVTP